MKGVIMMGGFGTRLEPLTLRTPKSLLPLAGKGNIIYMIEKMEEAGIGDIIISASTKNKKVEEYLAGKNVKFVFEDTNSDKDKLGVVRAIEYVKSMVGVDDFLVLGGDNFFEGFDMKSFCEYHKSNKPAATIGLFQLEDKSLVEKYGIAVLDESNRIVNFQEKPRMEEAKSRLASTFIQAISSEFLENHLGEYIKNEINQGRKPDKIGSMWEHYSKKLTVLGKDFRGYWGDICDAREYLKANKVAMKSLKTAGRIKGVKTHGEGIVVGEDVVFGKDVKLRGPVLIDSGVQIKNNALIGPYSHVMKGSVVGEASIVENSIVFENSKIGDLCRLNECIIDGNAVINDRCSIESGAIIGFQSELGRNTKVFSNSRIWPFMETGDDSVVHGYIKWPVIESEMRNKLVDSCYWK
jgi:mannose-1-phosphate guanylyltransferase/phosphomannomutase